MLEGLPDIFSYKRKKKAVKDEDEKAKLYEQIGRLKIENDRLKKNLPKPYKSACTSSTPQRKTNPTTPSQKNSSNTKSK